MPSRALGRAPVGPLALAALVVLALVEMTSRAGAQTTDQKPADGSVVVYVSGPDDPELRDSIRELLARLHLRVTDAAAPAEPDGGTGPAFVARVEVDLSSPADAVVVVTGETGDILFRRSVPRDASAAIVREEIAHEVQSAVESALLAARERASRSESAPPPPPVAPPPPVVEPPPPPAPTKERPIPASRPPRYGLEVTTLAGVSPISSSSGLAARVGLGIGAIAQKLPLRPSIDLSLLYALPFDTGEVGPTALSTTTSIASVRVLPALELLRGKWLAAEIGVGAGLDMMTVGPRPNTTTGYYLPKDTLKNGTTSIDPIFSAMVTVHAGLVPGVVFLLSAGIDVDPESRDYVLQSSTVTNVLTPSHVRPMVLAGFGFAALGDGHFGGGGAAR